MWTLTKYLLHQGRDGVPVGVWRTADDAYYPASAAAKEKYGRAVVEGRAKNQTWDEFIERMAFLTPGPADQWDIFEADGTLELEEVLDEATKDLTYGD